MFSPCPPVQDNLHNMYVCVYTYAYLHKHTYICVHIHWCSHITYEHSPTHAHSSHAKLRAACIFVIVHYNMHLP